MAIPIHSTAVLCDRDGPGLPAFVYLRDDHFQFVVYRTSNKWNAYMCSKGTSG